MSTFYSANKIHPLRKPPKQDRKKDIKKGWARREREGLEGKEEERVRICGLSASREEREREKGKRESRRVKKWRLLIKSAKPEGDDRNHSPLSTILFSYLSCGSTSRDIYSRGHHHRITSFLPSSSTIQLIDYLQPQPFKWIDLQFFYHPNSQSWK